MLYLFRVYDICPLWTLYILSIYESILSEDKDNIKILQFLRSGMFPQKQAEVGCWAAK